MSPGPYILVHSSQRFDIYYCIIHTWVLCRSLGIWWLHANILISCPVCVIVTWSFLDSIRMKDDVGSRECMKVIPRSVCVARSNLNSFLINKPNFCEVHSINESHLPRGRFESVFGYNPPVRTVYNLRDEMRRILNRPTVVVNCDD